MSDYPENRIWNNTRAAPSVDVIGMKIAVVQRGDINR
jgi:hypothetical protein